MTRHVVSLVDASDADAPEGVVQGSAGYESPEAALEAAGVLLEMFAFDGGLRVELTAEEADR